MVELIWHANIPRRARSARPCASPSLFRTWRPLNEGSQEREMMLDLFSGNGPGDWRNVRVPQQKMLSETAAVRLFRPTRS